MSEQETIALSRKIDKGIWEAQRRLFERKAKLGETIISADAQGRPCEISAEEALLRLERNSQRYCVSD